ncbi:MAG: hypothetical protein GX154_08120 [Clostridiales bacterium]|nr:hypothetical protein [Clostridiales bacterium]
MSKPLPRLHLRVAQDNPIYSVPPGERNKKAEEWLRLGANIENLELLLKKLEGLILHGYVPHEPSISDKSIKSKMQFINSILKLGEDQCDKADD